MLHFLKNSLYSFRRSPFFRGVICVLVVVIAIAVFWGLGIRHTVRPSISSISPEISYPGEELTILGSGFGSEKGTSYVEIAGSKVTESSYNLWTDGEIRLTIPSNVEDGLVYVDTETGRSGAAFFANREDIPVTGRDFAAAGVAGEAALTYSPVIEDLSDENAVPGQVISISGRNFGNARGSSKVYFTANREDNAGVSREAASVIAQSRASRGAAARTDPDTRNDVYISANELNSEYVSWADNEIRVKIPDGADSGELFVETAAGISEGVNITLSFPLGKKSYSNKRTYVLQLAADISNQSAQEACSILLYMPKPTVSSFQPSIELTEIFPEPFINDDAYDTIYKTNLNQLINNRQRFSQTFVVTTYSVQANLSQRARTAYENTDDALYVRYTSPDFCVPSDSQAVMELASLITGDETDPLRKARLIYDYFLQNYEISNTLRSGNVSVLDLIRSGSGDAYDFAVLYTALCRASGIAAVPVGGVLAYGRSEARPHWWTELYFEGYGYLSVDTALAAGLSFTPFIDIGDRQEFYFGNLDNQHIAFSRGWHQIRRTAQDSKVVYRPRTYALQSLWEEAGNTTSSYSSLWNNPLIQGIY